MYTVHHTFSLSRSAPFPVDAPIVFLIFKIASFSRNIDDDEKCCLIWRKKKGSRADIFDFLSLGKTHSRFRFGVLPWVSEWKTRSRVHRGVFEWVLESSPRCRLSFLHMPSLLESFPTSCEPKVGEPVVVDHSHPYHGGRTGMVTKVGTRATDDETCARSLQ